MCGEIMIVVLVRTVIIYIFVTISIRLMGKRQIGDMQPNELVVTLLISEIAAMPLQDTTQPVVLGIAAIFTLVILEIAVSVISLKSKTARRIFNGKAVVVIKNGKIDQAAMRKLRITVLDLIEMLRTAGIFNIDDVAFAVLEVNGTLSVMPKWQKRPPNITEVNAVPEKDVLPLPVIIDGRFLKDSLKELSVSKEQIKTLLSKQNITAENVFLLTLDTDGEASLTKREELS